MRFPCFDCCGWRIGVRIVGGLDIALSLMAVCVYISLYFLPVIESENLNNATIAAEKCIEVTFLPGVVITVLSMLTYAGCGVLFIALSFTNSSKKCLYIMALELVGICFHCVGIILLTSPNLCSFDYHRGLRTNTMEYTNALLSGIGIVVYKGLEFYILYRIWWYLKGKPKTKNSNKENSSDSDDRNEAIKDGEDFFRQHNPTRKKSLFDAPDAPIYKEKNQKKSSSLEGQPKLNDGNFERRKTLKIRDDDDTDNENKERKNRHDNRKSYHSHSHHHMDPRRKSVPAEEIAKIHRKSNYNPDTMVNEVRKSMSNHQHHDRKSRIQIGEQEEQDREDYKRHSSAASQQHRRHSHHQHQHRPSHKPN